MIAASYDTQLVALADARLSRLQEKPDNSVWDCTVVGTRGRERTYRSSRVADGHWLARTDPTVAMPGAPTPIWKKLRPALTVSEPGDK